jgi:hypothetical protein
MESVFFIFSRISRDLAFWPLARLIRDQEVAGSNPVTRLRVVADQASTPQIKVQRLWFVESLIQKPIDLTRGTDFEAAGR